MIYQGRVYGKIEIDDPLVLEIIKSGDFQRLKGINQAGYPPLYYNPKKLPLNKIKHNRFEHSIGVYLLLKKYQASYEEQIAGLIHDLSHGVFSHCLDYALVGGSETAQSHQDNIFKRFVKKTAVPKILAKYGVDLKKILKKENWLLLERELPDLCADRLDYSLRTAIIFQEISQKNLDELLSNLTTKNFSWVFKNLKSCRQYSQLFLRLNQFYYAGLSSAIMFRTIGDLIKYSLQKNYLNTSDLYQRGEEILLRKLRGKAKMDKKLKILLRRINEPKLTSNNPENFDAQVFCKSRIVDPLFLEKSGNNLYRFRVKPGMTKENFGKKKIWRLSEVDKKWGTVVKQEMLPKKYFLKFLN